MIELASQVPRPRRQQQFSISPQENFPRQSLVITGLRSNRPKKSFAIAASLLVLVCFWIVCFVSLLEGSDHGGFSNALVSDVHGQIERYRSGLRNEQEKQELEIKEDKDHHDRISPAVATKPHLVSRMPNNVVATA